ncbi:MAG: hypothetical protein E7256_16715 [Lachnospiraceae bacterium]|nr:hypothetical protein [Lachnospiraceae bacterium]
MEQKQHREHTNPNEKYINKGAVDASTINEVTHDKYCVGDIDICNACSTTDLTGLIPTPPRNDAEIDSYHQIFTFGPPDLK